MNALNAMFMLVFLYCAISAYGGTMPDTGQTKCYDAEKEITCPDSGADFFGQDAQYGGSDRSYSKMGNSGFVLPDTAEYADGWIMTRDNSTGLVWEMKHYKDGAKNYADPHDADNVYTWFDPNSSTNGGYSGSPNNGTDTMDFIEALNNENFGGFSDWRLPSIKELSSLVDYSVQLPAIDSNWFPQTMSDFYWSSSTSRFNGWSSYAWGVFFYKGGITDGFKGDKGYYARAVRGGKSQVFEDAIISGRMADNKDGTVTDTATGLMWQQGTASETFTWRDALAYAEALNLAGYSDWRLPNCNELRTLSDYSQFDPAIEKTTFPGTISDAYWSGTTDVFGEYYSTAWVVNCYYGYEQGRDKVDRLYIRAVRDARPLDNEGESDRNTCSGGDDGCFISVSGK